MRFSSQANYRFDTDNRAYQRWQQRLVEHFHVIAWTAADTGRLAFVTLQDRDSGDAFTVAVLESREVRDPQVLLAVTSAAQLLATGPFDGAQAAMNATPRPARGRSDIRATCPVPPGWSADEVVRHDRYHSDLGGDDFVEHLHPHDRYGTIDGRPVSLLQAMRVAAARGYRSLVIDVHDADSFTLRLYPREPDTARRRPPPSPLTSPELELEHAMLSFDTVHALPGHLPTTSGPAQTQRRRTHQVAASIGHPRCVHRPGHDLLLLHDGPAAGAPAGIRCMTCVAVPIDHAVVRAYRCGLPGLLPAGVPPLHAAWRRHAATVLSGVTAGPVPGGRLLAWAVNYDDIYIDTETHHDHATGAPAALLAVRWVDAIDVDSRVCQVVQRPGEHATVLIDDEPDPHDTPATHTGLVAPLAAVHRNPTPRPAAFGDR